MINNTVLMLASEQGEASPLSAFDGKIARLDLLNRPDELLTALSNVHIVWASVLVVVGALCIINGYRWHKWVIVICAFLAGLGLGHVLSAQMGQSRIVMAVIGLLCAVIATPLLRYVVAIFGGLTGAFIGANAWTAFSDAPDSHLAGAAMGFIAVGMAAFLMYRLVIVLFTSIGGGAMAVLGTLTLMLHVPTWETSIRTSLEANDMLLPLLVTVAAVTGLVLQHSHIKANSGDEDEDATAA
jgi:MFS family permease